MSEPRVDRLLEVALYVDDLERSASFYEALFGLEIIASDERIHAMGVAGQQVLLLCRRGASAALPSTPHDAAGEQHVAFAVAASELAAWEARLQRHDIAIEQRKEWPRGGHSLYFRDPDRHLIELATPGVWSIY